MIYTYPDYYKKFNCIADKYYTYRIIFIYKII